MLYMCTDGGCFVGNCGSVESCECWEGDDGPTRVYDDMQTVSTYRCNEQDRKGRVMGGDD